MRYIIVYDVPIEHDPYRKKISDILLSYNLIRMNYSVFFGELTRNLAEEIALKLRKLLKKIDGCDVRIIPVCNRCHRNAITVQSKFEDGYKIIEDILSL
jgi:CRISPR-associated protein Cas2